MLHRYMFIDIYVCLYIYIFVYKEWSDIHFMYYIHNVHILMYKHILAY